MIAFIVALLACWMVGATTVPLSCTAARNCTEAVAARLAACDESDCSVQFEAGRYELHAARNPVIGIYGKTGVTLSGQGSGHTELVFDDISTFFAVGGSRRVSFTGFSIDMVRVPFTLATVVAANSTHSDLRVASDRLYPTDAATQARFPYLARVQAIIGYDPQAQRFQLPDIYSLSTPFATAYRVSPDGVSMMTVARGGLSKGEWHVLRHQVYAYNAFEMSATSNVSFTDVVLYAAGGMGLYANQCSDITLTGFHTRRRRYAGGDGVDNVRAMSITADGIHLCNCRGGEVVVRAGVLEGQGDDGMNINTQFGRVVAISADRRTVRLQGYKGHLTSSAQFWAGARAEFFDGRTMAFKAFSPGTAAAISDAAGVTFSAPIPATVTLYDLVVNAGASVTGVLVDNVTFLNNRARGILMKQGGGVVRNCTFAGQTSPAILAQVDGCYWMEGRPFVGWTVQDSIIEGPDGFGPASVVRVDGQVPKFVNGAPSTNLPRDCLSVSLPGVFANVSVLSNTIVQRPGRDAKSVSVHATQGVTVGWNSIHSAAGDSEPDVQMQACSEVSTPGNSCFGDDGGARPCDIIP